MLNLEQLRENFPALDTPWALMDNAGGSVPCRQVIDRVRNFMERMPVQHGASYPLSVEAESAVEAGRQATATLIGAGPGEVVLGASSTTLIQTLASSLRPLWSEGDELIVTNLDHEANIGAWRKLADTGMVICEWRVREEDCDLHLEDLEELLGPRTRLVAFTHSSNVVGSVVDVATIAARLRSAGVLSCVDGVAYAPHRRVDVKALGVDFYCASLYKVFGPHMGVLYGRSELLKAAHGQHHFFVPEDRVPGKFEPGNVSYELAASLAGIVEYLEELDDTRAPSVSRRLDAAFERIAALEEALVTPLLTFLTQHPRVRVIGSESMDRSRRLPTLSFVVEGRRSSALPPLLEERQLAVRFGDFYARRLIDDLGLADQDGVVRVSLAHYNTPREVESLIDALEDLL